MHSGSIQYPFHYHLAKKEWQKYTSIRWFERRSWGRCALDHHKNFVKDVIDPCLITKSISVNYLFFSQLVEDYCPNIFFLDIIISNLLCFQNPCRSFFFHQIAILWLLRPPNPRRHFIIQRSFPQPNLSKRNYTVGLQGA